MGTTPTTPIELPNTAAPLNDKWIEHFYKECGREITLAYTTLNQMKNWAMIVAAAAISGIGFGTGAQTYPNERMFIGVVIVYTFVLRFFFRAIICYINLCRWNELQNLCIRLKLLDPSDSAAKTEEALREGLETFFFKWLSPIDRKTQIISNLKLGFALLFALPMYFLAWGISSLWSSPLVDGLAAFAIGTTIIEFIDFFTSTLFDNRIANQKRLAKRNVSVSNFPRPSNRSNYLTGWAIVILASVGIAAIQHHRISKLQAIPQTAQSPQASVQISSNPQGAEVFVDGLAIGKTPLTSQAMPGARNIQIKLNGFSTIRATILMRPNVEQVLNFELNPIQSGATKASTSSPLH